ncbi:glycosyltransferase family 8 protein [Micromonospora sp. NPDC048935]|uniref:glycosyltransferase family 8 protein n=1 Tax=Micromonospora sp. NPDC048935 TaxID=3364262 RepID=UPI003724A291
MSGPMHVAVAFDLGFVPWTVATMRSVAAVGIPPGGTVTWWLMPGADVPADVLAAVVEEGERVGDPRVLRVPTELDELPLSSWRMMSSRISNAAYYRLLLPDLVPDSVDRMLWLDSDVMCTGDLTELWQTDLEGALLGAAVDIGSPTVGAATGIPGLDPTVGRLTKRSDYFNSGVLLMDLPRCRAAELSTRSLDYIRTNAGKLRFAVQDAMNVAVDDRWLRLDPRWNDMDFFRFEQELGAVDETRIIHFAGKKKPWQESFPDGPLRDLYLTYLPRTPDLTAAR